jgi:hypothetical protein
VALALLACALLIGVLIQRIAPFTSNASQQRLEASSISAVPLAFEPNAGRAGTSVDYMAHSVAGGTLYLTSRQALLSLPMDRRHSRVLGIGLAGSNPGATPSGVDRLSGTANVFIGDDPAKWRSGLPTFGRVRYRDVYPGVDLAYYGNQSRLEYDFRLAPGAEAGRIALDVDGADSVRVGADGALVIAVGAHRIRQAPPVAFQTIGGERHPVSSAYTLDGRRVGFRLGAYDHTSPLTIDPLVLGYSTQLGGTGSDEGDAIAVDASGAAYIGGNTQSTDFPTQDPIAGQTGDENGNAFVAKVAPDSGGAVTLDYSTYLGGDGSNEYAQGVAVDSQGAAYVTGSTDSTDFPIVDPIAGQSTGSDNNAFVAKLNPDSGGAVTLGYSTYLGGTGQDTGNAIAVDSSGAAYVAGQTSASDFPTQDAPQPTYGTFFDAFVTRVNPEPADVTEPSTSDDASLAYSTYLGGSGSDSAAGIAVDPSGAAYVAGTTNPIITTVPFPTQDAFQATSQGSNDEFVTKYSPDPGGATAPAVAYSTLLGGGGYDNGRALAVDSSGAAYIAGESDSSNFPTTDEFQPEQPGKDAVVTKLNPDPGGANPVTLAYSTYLGGGGTDFAVGIAVDSTGAAYVTGNTDSGDFPTLDPFQTDQPLTDVFVTKFNADSGGAASLAYSTYLGGSSVNSEGAGGVAVDPTGVAYVAGETNSGDFPAQDPLAGQTGGSDENAFVARLLQVPVSTTPPPSAGAPPVVSPRKKKCKKKKHRAVTAKKCKKKK